MKNIKFPSVKPHFIITMIFVVIVILELFLLYTQVYTKLSPEADSVPNENIVRLDLAAYNQTIELLDALKEFVVNPWNLINPEPF